MQTPPISYTGRFAPSPTGPLHFGSLVCALGSYLDAAAHSGHWLVRIEDLDPPRAQPGAADQILRALEAHGLYWHGTPKWQSRRHALYQQALGRLTERSLLYHCHCSRAQIREHGGHQNLTCRRRKLTQGAFALRFKCTNDGQSFIDIWRGNQYQPTIEDPILQRRDGYYAYQLAVVVDDIEQKISHVIRGADLLDCTGTQLQLFSALGATPPQFGHLPLVLNLQGQKLSKQNKALPLDNSRAGHNLCLALRFLGFRTPTDLNHQPPSNIISWAKARWQRQLDIRDRQLH